MRVGGKRAGTASEHHAAACQMVEQCEAVRDVERMMVRNAHHARTQHDPLGARGRDRHEDFGRRNDLPSGRMMLADEGFFIAELIEPLDQLHVAFETQGWVFADSMKRRHENSESHFPILCGERLNRRSVPHPMTGAVAKTSAA